MSEFTLLVLLVARIVLRFTTKTPNTSNSIDLYKSDLLYYKIDVQFMSRQGCKLTLLLLNYSIIIEFGLTQFGYKNNS